MRILHFGDLHLGMENYGKIDPQTGLHSRLGDFVQSLDTVVNYAIGSADNKIKTPAQPVDLVVFAGDAFKTRDPSPTYIRAFARAIRKIADHNIPVVMVVGNHDLPNAPGRADTLDVFATLAVPGVVVSREPEYLKISTRAGQIQIVTLPWMYKSQLFTREDVLDKTGEQVQELFTDKLVKLFRLAMAKIDSKIPAIALVHATVEGASYGSERSVLLGSDVIIPLKLLTGSHIQYVALGHIHQHQFLSHDPPVSYCGSLERIDFGEEKEDKGFIEVTITDKTAQTKFIKVPVRTFQTIAVQLSTQEQDPTEKVVHQIKKDLISGAVARVNITCDESLSAAIREAPIREALSEASFIAGITKHLIKAEKITQVDGYSDRYAAAGPLENLLEYLEAKKLPKAKIDRLQKAALELMEDVDQGSPN